MVLSFSKYNFVQNGANLQPPFFPRYTGIILLYEEVPLTDQ